MKSFFLAILCAACIAAPLYLVSWASEKMFPTSPEAKAAAHARYMAIGRY